VFSTFDEFVQQATGLTAPYPYQRLLAERTPPEVLCIPTGCGKTASAVLPWLFRRRFHPDTAVRLATPRRLVYVLPMRALVEQTVGLVPVWIERLGLSSSVKCHVLMGGEPRLAEWRLHPESDAVIVGTLDMILSRALNRGFGESRYLWPIDFGLLNNDCHYVFDELQLMGPALATSRQLHAFRSVFGTAVPCSSTWMSATVDPTRLVTVDAPEVGSTVELSGHDLADPVLSVRLAAARVVTELQRSPDKKGHARTIAEAALKEHRAGTRTLVVVNTVDIAQSVADIVRKADPAARIVLLHSRFRPPDRAAGVRAMLEGPAEAGTIVIATQVLEAGVDVTSSTLITEAAPWPSIVQRAGRCNRDGMAIDARVFWVEPFDAAPYETLDVERAVDRLRQLEGHAMTSQSLVEQAVPTIQPIWPVLRRRDLVEFFDTLPDLSGNDIDVSPFLRDSDDTDVAIAWRQVLGSRPDDETPMPGRDERCPVSLAAARRWLKAATALRVWRWDPLDAVWVACRADALRPGQVLIADAAMGGYEPQSGWRPGSSALVNEIHTEPGADDQSTADDPASVDGRCWVTLVDHLDDTRRVLASMLDALGPVGLSAAHQVAAVKAAQLHDIGKAHPVFRGSMTAGAPPGDVPPSQTMMAKSPYSVRHSVKNFRHELASALALLAEGASVLAGDLEFDLTVYLVAAHHGRVRLGARSLPGDERGASMPAILGVEPGDVLPPLDLGWAELPASVLDTACLSLGRGAYGRSWSERAIGLRDRADLGLFRLGYLEALVRLADWAASAEPTPYVAISEADHG
jgi:CRISPR-associated endonuclease/helicase Cas3